MSDQPVAPAIDWQGKSHMPDATRLVAFCGGVAIGAVFLPVCGRQRFVRWRIWCSENLNPAEGSASNVESAKKAVEDRFQRFLSLAGLIKKT